MGRLISAGDIALVESAWQIPDTVVSSQGWVLVMKDGQRLYLEYTLDDTRAGAPEEIEIIELRSGELYPPMEGDSGVFDYRPDHINAHLGVTPPSLH